VFFSANVILEGEKRKALDIGNAEEVVGNSLDFES
jgi:hypothetical protein